MKNGAISKRLYAYGGIFAAFQLLFNIHATSVDADTFADQKDPDPSAYNVINLNELQWRDPISILQATPLYPQGVAINMNYILETGNVPYYNTFEFANLYRGNQSVNWHASDKLIRAISNIKANVIAEIENADDLQELLGKQDWQHQDRVKWERRIAGLVTQQFASTQGLSRFRQEGQSSNDINALSHDIGKESNSYVYKCKTMAVLKGAVLQAVEERFLPASDRGNSNKSAADYYLVGGHVVVGDNYYAHSYIFSPATGGVIEPTITHGGRNSMAYNENTDKRYGLKELVNGQRIVPKSGPSYVPGL